MKNFLKENWFKLVLPIAILIGFISIGGFYFASQVNKQQSIERQQILQQIEDRRIEDAKAEQAKKEYNAKRKSDCLTIYKTESDKFNNVRGWRYDENSEECFIRYKDSSPKTDAQCDKNYPVGGDYKLTFFMANSLCKEGEFENSF